LAAARKAAASSESAAVSISRGSVKAAAEGEIEKPVSKLAQRIAASRVAKTAPATEMDTHMHDLQVDGRVTDTSMNVDTTEVQEVSPLFSFTSAMASTLTSNAPSTFFALLTTKPTEVISPPPTKTGLTSLSEDPFAGPSPDDLVLAKREKTRLGAGGGGGGGGSRNERKSVDAGVEVMMKKQRVA
jgi:hypothetical protein